MYVQNVVVHAGTTRTCVSTCTRGAGIHGDVLNVHAEVFFESTHGKQEVIISSAYHNLPTYGYHVLQKFTKETFGSFPNSVLRIDREQHVSDSSNHSLWLIKLSIPAVLVDTAEGTSHRMVRFVFRHQNPSITNDLHDLPQWFHVFSTFLMNFYIQFLFLSCHELSRTPQHSKWNCVGANKPQHMHMDSHMVCD